MRVTKVNVVHSGSWVRLVFKIVSTTARRVAPGENTILKLDSEANRRGFKKVTVIYMASTPPSGIVGLLSCSERHAAQLHARTMPL